MIAVARQQLHDGAPASDAWRGGSFFRSVMSRDIYMLWNMLPRA